LIERERLIERGERVLVAVSGGPDSMALLHVLARLRGKLGFDLVAHGVDHGLRSEAAAELSLAIELAHHLGVPMGVTSVQVEKGGNLQARARELRHRALGEALRASGATKLATGHHADDRAETVLLRLLQGSGPAGLGCLPPRQEEKVRPLLGARRADILLHLGRHAVRYAQDPSNHDPVYLRSQVRHELMPVLERLSPSIVAHLNALADELHALPAASDGLGRAQRRQLMDAVHRGQKGVQVRLEGGLDAWASLASGAVMITKQQLPGASE
jgi:tRNA(Ile)-lysidine synthase